MRVRVIIILLCGYVCMCSALGGTDRIGYIARTTNMYAVGNYSVTNNTLTCWSNVFVTTDQLPQTGPYSPTEYIFEQGKRPSAEVSIKNGARFISFPSKSYHIYGKTNLCVNVINPPMACVLNRQDTLLFGFSTGERRFFIVDKLKNSELKIQPDLKARWEEINIQLPSHRTNDLEALKEKYIKDYGKKNK